ncbi:hypothetical protein [Cryobacterium sp. HLT2-28]|uniref:hypothetical protein n=1 Tax=Cryobacterium sp. HLT2-28 TaxID=1259146 RepID=UPI0015803A7B|nr:hypothetical protein [Cryobacterium sp. HLT2-28]
MDAESAFNSLAAELSPAGAVTAKMFGARAITLRKKAFACLQGDAIAFKLGAGSPEHTRALTIPGAGLWDPSGLGRPFTDWVLVPAIDGPELSGLAEAALTGLAAALS